ncbi:tyrosine-type recombinase/integrase [Sphingomonas sp. BK345]|uniref:tyrosine-type recombinase/integrase n=1 Tax=Sphingomonas sp. BK345 TaxID=2586980 RepID=UPI00179AE8E4|nr:tyrosine-type recombinase/integrase [Sphingomonas sp. BK345]MBB3475600.1 integrase [Sphingomonas sp. BK345]
MSKGVHTADSQSITVAQAADLWIQAAEAKDRERSTIKQYKEWAELHIKPLIGSKRLSQLSMPAVERFKDALLQTRSPAMAGKVVRGLSSIITEAQRRGLVAQNVAKGVKVIRSRRDRGKVTIPSREDVRALLAIAAADEKLPALYPMLLTVALAGLRSSELRGLRKDSVDLKRGEIHITQRADQWGVIGSPKSEAGSRTIPIPPVLVAELRKWMLRAPRSDLGLLFPNSDGGVRLHSNLLNREYWPAQVKAGLVRPAAAAGDEEPRARARYDFHALRHYAASAWIKQRVDLKRLTTWLGHSSVQITLDTYGHLIRDDLGDAAIAAATAQELLA